MMKLKQLTLCVFAVVASGSTYAQGVQVSVTSADATESYGNAIYSIKSLTSTSTDKSGQYYIVNFNSDNNIYFAKNDGSNEGVHLMEIDRDNGKVVIGFSTTEQAGPSLTITGNDGAQGYSTICSPFLLKVPAKDFKVYEPTYDSQNKVLKLGASTLIEEGTILQRNTPLIVKTTTMPKESVTVSFDGHSTFDSNDVTANRSTNVLSGTIHSTTVDASSVYTLGRTSLEAYKDKVGFYIYTSTEIPACKAYIEKSKLSSGTGTAKSIMFIDEDVPTEINGIKVINSKGTTEKYNLNGQRVTDSAKGIIIINGKKYIHT